MKLFITIFFLCLFLGSSVFAQPETPPLTPAQVGVEEIFLARDNGEGKPGDPVEGFLTTDVPIYCVVQLNSVTPSTVKMNFVAVAVKGVKAETNVITVSFKTNGKQSRVYFTGTPDGTWLAGTYRADIFVDGKPAGSKEFKIQNSALTNPAVKSLQPKSGVPKPKPAKRPRKTNFTDR